MSALAGSIICEALPKGLSRTEIVEIFAAFGPLKGGEDGLRFPLSAKGGPQRFFVDFQCLEDADKAQKALNGKRHSKTGAGFFFKVQLTKTSKLLLMHNTGINKLPQVLSHPPSEKEAFSADASPLNITTASLPPVKKKASINSVSINDSLAGEKRKVAVKSSRSIPFGTSKAKPQAAPAIVSKEVAPLPLTDSSKSTGEELLTVSEKSKGKLYLQTMNEGVFDILEGRYTAKTVTEEQSEAIKQKMILTRSAMLKNPGSFKLVPQSLYGNILVAAQPRLREKPAKK